MLCGPGFHMDCFLTLCNKSAPGLSKKNSANVPLPQSGGQSWDGAWLNLGEKKSLDLPWFTIFFSFLKTASHLHP
jgi:hypothetical protein